MCTMSVMSCTYLTLRLCSADVSAQVEDPMASDFDIELEVEQDGGGEQTF